MSSLTPHFSQFLCSRDPEFVALLDNVRRLDSL